MANIDADRFIELIRLSQTVDDSALEEVLSSASESVRSDSEKLALRLIADGLLTRWQCDHLLSGKHKGFRIGSYRVKRKIGRGGMSTVYLGEHVLMHREAAIKVLPRKRVEDSSYLARFHREAKAAASLDHPNIVRIYDVTSDGDVHFIAMEYIAGQDLQSLVKTEGVLDFDKAADYIAQSAVGLQHAHDIGLVHRDIKPANLLANEKGIVKVLDMGLAKFDSENDDLSLTRDHNESVLGTVDYLSPEQAVDSHRVDHRADIYSLGCTLYYVLVGHAPFPQGNIAQRIVKHMRSKPKPIKKTRPDVPRQLADICTQMMAKDPNDRPQTAQAVAELLGDFLAARGKSVTGMGDSGIGSRLDIASAAARELADSSTSDSKGGSDARHAVATDLMPSEADRETTISGPQDETHKSLPVEIPDNLQLAAIDDDEDTKDSAATNENIGLDESGVDNMDSAIDSVVDMGQLQKQLKPLTSREDQIMEPLVPMAESSIPPRPANRSDEGLPIWIWVLLGTVAVAILGLAVIMILN